MLDFPTFGRPVTTMEAPSRIKRPRRAVVPDWLLDLFARYGYAVVFLGVLLENSGLPVPGETALLAGGALAHYGRLSLGRVIVIAFGGAVLGDNLGFAIGRRVGRSVLERHGWRIGLTRFRLAQFNSFFERHGARTVFVARFITGRFGSITRSITRPRSWIGYRRPGFTRSISSSAASRPTSSCCWRESRRTCSSSSAPSPLRIRPSCTPI